MIYKYLLEIRYRAFFSFIAWSFLTFNCYFFKETLLYTFIKFSWMHHYNNTSYFLITDVTEVFVTYLQLSYFIANQITFIFICYQIFVFASTGLYQFEYIYLKNISIIILICWVVFVLILNNFIFPASWSFFLQSQFFEPVKTLTFYFEAKLSEYWNFYTTIYNISYFIYQLIVFFWIFLNLFKANFLIVKKLRKVWYFAFFLVATCITPPEVIYQLIVSICTIIIYELVLMYLLLKVEFINLSRKSIKTY
jgi:sec-independent protein translocase protein TatC